MRSITSKRTFKNLWALLHAGVLVVVSYLLWNIPLTLHDCDSLLKMTSLIRTSVAEPDTLPSDLLLINTCYDHTFVPVCSREITKDTIGQISVTDRRKLLTLLQALALEDDYRYVVCDIRFDSSLKTETDSALFSLLSQMPRCCVPTSLAMDSLPEKLAKIAATSEYGTNILNSDFLKYQYLTDIGESIALRMANETDGISITRCGPFYFMGWKPCINSHIVDIKTNVKNEYASNLSKNILHLGSDMLPILETGVEGMFKDKIVIIGDCFMDDMHNTAAGTVSGVMIIYNAYKALVEQYNVPAWWVWLLMLFVYYLLTISTFYHFEPHNLLDVFWLRDKPLLNLLLDWIGFEVLFTFVALLTYYMASLYIDAWICATYFTVFNKIYQYKELRNI